MSDSRTSHLASLPGVARLRSFAERAFAPRLRADVAALQVHFDHLRAAHDQLTRHVAQVAADQDRLIARLDALEQAVTELHMRDEQFQVTADRLESRLSMVGDSVATSNALARRVQRELDRVTAASPATDRTT